MSDSVDRVFVKAISTIKALSSRSNYGSLPRPPAENRIKLYGLYKQATEGDVNGIMPRPVGFTPEDEGAKKKWDAWKREEGLSKIEAKRKYISYLIETMRIYASGTLEARELLNELEYLWDQIKNVPVLDEGEYDIPLPSRSPSFSQYDRFSNKTPSLSGRSNLQRIYSHSRKLSMNEYVQQQRQQQPHDVQSGVGPTHGGGPESFYSLPGATSNAKNTTIIEDFKNWQNDVNLIINKLTREFVNSRRETQEQSDSEDDIDDDYAIVKRKIIHILKVIGWNSLKFLKNFSVSLFTILFIVWCIKKNVVVKSTIIKDPALKGKQNKELVINMVMKTNENKWFIRLLNFINNFVGFV